MGHSAYLIIEDKDSNGNRVALASCLSSDDPKDMLSTLESNFSDRHDALRLIGAGDLDDIPFSADDIPDKVETPHEIFKTRKELDKAVSSVEYLYVYEDGGWGMYEMFAQYASSSIIAKKPKQNG